ncbi:hypothetical protein ACJ5NV_18990, partial [Loktanella agnita]
MKTIICRGSSSSAYGPSLLRIAPLTPQAYQGTVSVRRPRAQVTGFHRVLAARCGFPFRARMVLRSALLSATAFVAVAAPVWADTINGGAVEIVDGNGLAGAGGTGTQPSPWDATSNLIVGRISTGALQIIAGGAVSGSAGYIGDTSGSTGTVMVTGTDSSLTIGRNLYVGKSGTGTLTIAEGGAVSSLQSVIGFVANSTGTVSVTGTDSSLTIGGKLYVGQGGTGTLTIADGGVVEAGAVTLARNATSSGTLNIGAAAGDAAVAAGTLEASTVVFGAGTG